MNKKMWLLILAIIVLTLSLLLYFLKPAAIYRMNGRVTEVNGNLVIVSGVARFSESGAEHREKRTINFQLVPKTIFKKTTTILHRSNNNFSSEVTPGSASDIAKNMRIVRIESSQNLFTNNEATASHVNYEVIEFRD